MTEDLFKEAADDVKIDKARLDQELAEVNSKVIYWGQKLSNAQADYTRAESLFNSTEKEVSRNLRNRLESTGKKPTVASLEELVYAHPDFRKAKSDLDDAKIKLQALRTIHDAIQQKGPMAINIAKLYIQEAQTGITITEGAQQRTEQKYNSQKLRDRVSQQ